MIPFVAPCDDILFSLRHVAGMEDDLARDVLGHFAQFAEEVLAPLNAVGDAQGARLLEGRVRMPDGFAAAYRALADGGWQGLRAPEAFGGMDQSPLIAAAVSEVFSGANHALQMVCGLVPGAIETLRRFGTPAQQAAWIPRLASGAVLSTMCLTEAGAGSDLARIRTRAVHDGAAWRITGEKIFISGGDQDMSEGILHLVLARTDPTDHGTRGLSLFACPAGPDVRVTRLEEKLGLHASPTCAMLFEDAPAELIGDAGQGLAAMFTVMNHARIDVALQGVAHAARAAQIARTYAEGRVQGRRADGTDACLADHADVVRMLETQDRLALGARGMCHVALAEIHSGARPALVEFLTPVCKVFGSEAGIRVADIGIQVLGGYGYLTEYGIGQTWRDARITAIYEGANGIHARALVTRGLKGPGADQFADLLAALSGDDAALAQARLDWCAARDRLRASTNPEAEAHDFMQATGQIFFAAVWARIAANAAHHPDPQRLTRLNDPRLV